MISRLLEVVLFVFVLAISGVSGQKGIPCDSLKASKFCYDAPIICDLDCLNGFSARMPDTLCLPQPTLLCETGGTPNNMSWFAFIAGSDSIQFQIIPSNCTPGNTGPFDIGLQAGIISDCALDMDGEIPPGNRIACHDLSPMDRSFNPFSIGANNFVVGEVYYFFIDGVAGSVCDYTVMVEFGSQPLELEEIPGLVTLDGPLNDTICQGFKDLLIFPDQGELNIDYYWRMTPPSANYPADTFQLLDYANFWTFDEAGTFEIQMFATNGCDETDTVRHPLLIMPEPDEVFDTVSICYNDFPYIGPQNEDPNGDGVIGWLGPMIQYPGGDESHLVTKINGCYYTQRIHVAEIPPKPRENVTIYSCGPFDYHGTLITQNENARPINILDGTNQGCDSLVSLTAYILEIEGDIQVRNCDSSGLTIGFDATNTVLPPGTVLEYDWFDTAGPIMDNDSNPDDVMITKMDSYSVSIRAINGMDTCTFNFPAKVIDPNDNKPTITAVDWTLNICDDDNIGTYQVTSDQASKLITWSLPPGTNLINGTLNDDYIEVDFSNTSGGTVMVTVENFCSGVSVLDFDVEIVETPVADFTLPAEICVDSIFTLVPNGLVNPAFSYIWRIPNQAIVVNGSLNSGNPVDIRLNGNPGPYPVELFIANGNCADTATAQIELLPQIPLLTIDCEPRANDILFSWNAESCAESYNVFINGVFVENTTATSYRASGFSINTNVNIEVEVVSSCACKGRVTTSSCRTLDCGPIGIDLMVPDNFICREFWPSSLPVSYNLTGGTGNGQVTWTGNFINNGDFTPSAAGPGNHTVHFTYDEDGCIYTDSIRIVLFEDPQGEVQTFDPQCIEDLLGSISISASGGTGSYEYILDGATTIQPNWAVPVGSHTVQIIDGNSCREIHNFTINPGPTISYAMEGELNIYETEDLFLSFNYTVGENTEIDSIQWYIDGVLHCSGLNCRDFDDFNPEPGTYEHTIVIFYNDCVLEERYDVVVRETAKIYISTAFSPNGDGSNDHWKIATNDETFRVTNVLVFDRWGNGVFRKSDFVLNSEPELWDGRMNGRLVPPGVYVYIIDYIDEFGIRQTEEGSITVLH